MITGKPGSVNKVIAPVERDCDEWSELLCKVDIDKGKEEFPQTFSHFAPMIKGFLMEVSSLAHELAEDVVQETMIKERWRVTSFDPFGVCMGLQMVGLRHRMKNPLLSGKSG